MPGFHSLQRTIADHMAGTIIVCKAHAVTLFAMSRSFSGGRTRLTALLSTHQVERQPMAGRHERRSRVQARLPARRSCRDWGLRIYLRSIAHWVLQVGQQLQAYGGDRWVMQSHREGQHRGERRGNCRQAIANALRTSA